MSASSKSTDSNSTSSSVPNSQFNLDFARERFGDKVRVRFAPSPTGQLHIGGVRTAIYNWAFARHNGGTFILRIDDTDPERSTKENVDVILDALRWLGIDWDEGAEVGGEFGPYYQMQRMNVYKAALDKMIAEGTVYPCFCSAEELAQKREANQKSKGYTGYDRTCRNLSAEVMKSKIASDAPHTWRIKVPLDMGDIVFHDEIYGECSFKSDVIDDFVIVRSDGTPTYNFSTVVDDACMGITHVIRGDDHLSNTPRQIAVYNALGAQIPTFAHLSMINGPDGKKLSKRHGATSVQAFRDKGYLPDAMLNYLALLGWSLDGETTIFDMQTLFEHFTLDRINKSPAVFDETKLEWMNSVYIKNMGAAKFVDTAIPWLEASGLATAKDVSQNRAWFEAIYPLVFERVKKMTDLAPMIQFLFSGDDVLFDEKSVEKILKKEDALPVLEQTEQILKDKIATWDESSINQALHNLPEKMDLKPRKVFQVIRVAITGTQVSPPLFESMALLTRQNCLSRISKAKHLASGA